MNVTVKQKRGVDQGGQDGPLITPMQMQWAQIEAKTRELGYSSEAVAAAAAAYEEQQREAESRSHMNADLDNALSQKLSKGGQTAAEADGQTVGDKTVENGD